MTAATKTQISKVFILVGLVLFIGAVIAAVIMDPRPKWIEKSWSVAAVLVAVGIVFRFLARKG